MTEDHNLSESTSQRLVRSLQRLSSLLSQLTDTVADAEKDLSDGE